MATQNLGERIRGHDLVIGAAGFLIMSLVSFANMYH